MFKYLPLYVIGATVTVFGVSDTYRWSGVAIIIFAVLLQIPDFVWALKRKSLAIDLNALIDEHLPTLRRRRAATTFVDHYGREVDSKWRSEVDYFWKNVVVPRFDAATLESVVLDYFTLINSTVLRSGQIRHGTEPETLSPEEYEAWCTQQLVDAGWDASLTKSGADQGADIVARRGSVSVAIQCKRYSAPVGNKAVQEAFASTRHYGTAFAAVVSSSTYTRAAIELAGTTGVILLHHSEIESLHSRIRDVSSK